MVNIANLKLPLPLIKKSSFVYISNPHNGFIFIKSLTLIRLDGYQIDTCLLFIPYSLHCFRSESEQLNRNRVKRVKQDRTFFKVKLYSEEVKLLLTRGVWQSWFLENLAFLFLLKKRWIKDKQTDRQKEKRQTDENRKRQKGKYTKRKKDKQKKRKKKDKKNKRIKE